MKDSITLYLHFPSCIKLHLTLIISMAFRVIKRYWYMVNGWQGTCWKCSLVFEFYSWLLCTKHPLFLSSQVEAEHVGLLQEKWEIWSQHSLNVLRLFVVIRGEEDSSFHLVSVVLRFGAIKFSIRAVSNVKLLCYVNTKNILNKLIGYNFWNDVKMFKTQWNSK